MGVGVGGYIRLSTTTCCLLPDRRGGLAERRVLRGQRSRRPAPVRKLPVGLECLWAWLGHSGNGNTRAELVGGGGVGGAVTLERDKGQRKEPGV